MTQYKVVALDLDGTLTNSDKVITPRTQAALEEAARQGVRIVLASGRPTVASSRWRTSCVWAKTAAAS